MTLLTLWLIVVTIERSIASKHRSVNLALETVLEFDKVDDVKVVNKVQDFLKKVQNLLNKNERRYVSTRRKKTYQFSDFMEDVVTEIQSLGDDNLKEVFKIINKDIKKRKTNDILDDNARRYLSNKLTELSQKPITEIRTDLDDLLRELKNNKSSKSNYILSFINTLYEHNAGNKLSKFVKGLNLFRRNGSKSKIDLKNIIEKVINDVIYEHYNNLEGDERRHIKKYVRSFFGAIEKKIQTKEKSHKNKDTEQYEKSDQESSTSEVQALEINSVNVFKQSTKKLYTHITLYPKTVRERRKFRTGIPLRKIPPEDVKETPTEDINDVNGEYKISEDTDNVIHTNHSVEINVNLLLKEHKDSREYRPPRTFKTIKHKYKPSQRAITKKSKKRKNHTKQATKSKTTSIESSETFGNLYKKTTINYITTKSSTDGTESTVKEMILRTMMDADPKEIDENNLQEYRRKNTVFEKHEIPYTSTTKVSLKTTIKPVTTEEISTKRTTISNPETTELIIITTPTTVVTTESTTEVSKASSISTTDSVLFNEIRDINITDAELTRRFANMDTITDNIDIAELNSTLTNDTKIFNIDEYIKKTDFQDIESEDKKKSIQKKMKEDLEFLMSTPTTNATEPFTDVFKELEDAFQI